MQWLTSFCPVFWDDAIMTDEHRRAVAKGTACAHFASGNRNAMQINAVTPEDTATMAHKVDLSVAAPIATPDTSPMIIPDTKVNTKVYPIP